MLSSLLVKCLIILSLVYNPVLAVDSTIKFIIVIVRNADRAPDPALELYWKDQYRQYNFDPPGFGHVTKKGELRALAVGKFLRNTYKDFLAPTYIPGSIEARYINMARTKESLNFILKGLYPEAVIPTVFDSTHNDVLLCPQLCPEYIDAYIKAREAPGIKSELTKLAGVMKNLTATTGSNMNAAIALYLLYTTFDCEKCMNLALPDWSKKFYPKGDLLKAMLLEFEIMNYGENMIRRNGGRLIKKIKEDMESVKSGSMDKNRKLMLYSVFDLNIVAVLKALGVYHPHATEFSSAIIIELHFIKNVYSVKVNYYNGESTKIENLTIPRCEMSCPLDKFSNLMKNVIPSAKDLVCVKEKGVKGAVMGKFTGIFSE